MEASHLNALYPSRDNAVSQFTSTHVGNCLLLAIGIIILIGSLVATGCLYSRLGFSSFAIGGSGLILSGICFLSSYANRDQYTEQNREVSISSISSRLPCRHEGNSCFVNSALQIMAHLTDFRNLFDKELHPLEKGREDDDDCLSKRQKVQEAGHKLINSILKGEQVKNLKEFVTLVNSALEAIKCLDGNGEPEKFNIQVHGDARLLISCIENILRPGGLIYGFSSSDLNQLDQINESLSQQEDLPTILVFDSEESCPYRSEIVINNIGTYRLAAVRITIRAHSIPIICSESGHYFKLDDVVGRAEEISENELSNILTHNKRSPSAYYVKAI